MPRTGKSYRFHRFSLLKSIRKYTHCGTYRIFLTCVSFYSLAKLEEQHKLHAASYSGSDDSAEDDISCASESQFSDAPADTSAVVLKAAARTANNQHGKSLDILDSEDSATVFEDALDDASGLTSLQDDADELHHEQGKPKLGMAAAGCVSFYSLDSREIMDDMSTGGPSTVKLTTDRNR